MVVAVTYWFYFLSAFGQYYRQSGGYMYRFWS